jgi:hypothetical protein
MRALCWSCNSYDKSYAKFDPNETLGGYKFDKEEKEEGEEKIAPGKTQDKARKQKDR